MNRIISAVAVLLCFSCVAPSSAFAKQRSKYPEGMIEIRDIDANNLAPVQKKFDELVDAGETNILFRINSFGGNIFEGLDFIQHIEDAKKHGVHVQCVVDTHAMSMGFAFLQSFCDERLMTKRSVLLAHNGQTQAQGDPHRIHEQEVMVKALSDAMAEICAARLHMSIEAYKVKIDNEAWTMSWQEALKVGAVDKIVDPAKLPPLYELEQPKPDLLQMLLGQ